MHPHSSVSLCLSLQSHLLWITITLMQSNVHSLTYWTHWQWLSLFDSLVLIQLKLLLDYYGAARPGLTFSVTKKGFSLYNCVFLTVFTYLHCNVLTLDTKATQDEGKAETHYILCKCSTQCRRNSSHKLITKQLLLSSKPTSFCFVPRKHLSKWHIYCNIHAQFPLRTYSIYSSALSDWIMMQKLYIASHI